jgi:hypothetical protein
MCELKKIGKVFTSKIVGTGPSSYEKRIYRAAVSQGLRNAGLEDINVQELQNVINVAELLRGTVCLLEVIEHMTK